MRPRTKIKVWFYVVGIGMFEFGYWLGWFLGRQSG